MRSITLTLIVHDHQPVGNFDGVIARACDDAYDPFLDFLERHPRLRIAMHVSGPLLEWLARHRRAHVARLRSLVVRGQVEIWGGGFYEPVLSAIPEVDRIGQIRALSDWIEEELGKRPRGLWLTERVWEPSLPRTLAEAGIAYTAVDDAHFLAAGLERDALWGPYLSEDQGHAVRILPIHRDLRYRIPFEAPERTIELLAQLAAGGEGRLAVLGDDGEKFGVWPGTRERCWKDGWLERFAAALEAAPWIDVLPPGEALDRHAPLGLAYLPTASYHEMAEWSLPATAQRRYRAAAKTLEPAYGSQAHDLLRGGHWRAFQMRYPESNRMHKRMLRASRRLHALPDRDGAWREARTHLWRSQCNCAYWHGVFGGLYLPLLREAIYRELIAVERYLAPPGPHLERGDVDLDGCEDAVIETPEWAAWVSVRGGSLWAFDDRRGGLNWGDTLARHDEAFHDALAGVAVGGGEGQTIHSAVHVTETGLAELAAAPDVMPRDSFQERWIGDGEAIDWAARVFEFESAPTREIRLVSTATTVSGNLTLAKRYRPQAREGLETELTLRSAAKRSGRFEVALHLGVHVPNSPDRFVVVNGDRAERPAFSARASHARVRRLDLVDQWAGVRLEIELDREADLDRSPIETVSLSERGAERVFQGIAARFSFPLELEPGQPWTVRFTLRPAVERAA